MRSQDFHRFDFYAMGSASSLCLHCDSRKAAVAVADAAVEEVDRLERLYSRNRPDSFLAEINRSAAIGGNISIDRETSFLIDAALQAHAKSDGLFDVTSGRYREIWNDHTERVPTAAEIARLQSAIGLEKVSWTRPRLSFGVRGMELDFGGIVKEYAADRIAGICRSLGSLHGIVNLGGDISLIGSHPNGGEWRIGVCDPMSTDDAVATLFVAEGGVATSGDYERYWIIDGRKFSHFINPRTGWPVDALPSVTVVAESCLAAGVASTIGILKEDDGPNWLRVNVADHFFVDRTGTIGGSIQVARRLH